MLLLPFLSWIFGIRYTEISGTRHTCINYSNITILSDKQVYGHINATCWQVLSQIMYDDISFKEHWKFFGLHYVIKFTGIIQ
jgi:hypothetical protein